MGVDAAAARSGEDGSDDRPGGARGDDQALGVLAGLVVVSEAAGAAAHGPTAAARELVAGEVVGSPQLVSLSRTIWVLRCGRFRGGTTLINGRGKSTGAR
jgi:hypothetical protein